MGRARLLRDLRLQPLLAADGGRADAGPAEPERRLARQPGRADFRHRSLHRHETRGPRLCRRTHPDDRGGGAGDGRRTRPRARRDAMTYDAKWAEAETQKRAWLAEHGL